jgi:hypothetical protein
MFVETTGRFLGIEATYKRILIYMEKTGKRRTLARSLTPHQQGSADDEQEKNDRTCQSHEAYAPCSCATPVVSHESNLLYEGCRLDKPGKLAIAQLACARLA